MTCAWRQEPHHCRMCASSRPHAMWRRTRPGRGATCAPRAYAASACATPAAAPALPAPTHQTCTCCCTMPAPHPPTGSSGCGRTPRGCVAASGARAAEMPTAGRGARAVGPSGGATWPAGPWRAGRAAGLLRFWGRARCDGGRCGACLGAAEPSPLL
jgi:hypothetical protein